LHDTSLVLIIKKSTVKSVFLEDINVGINYITRKFNNVLNIYSGHYNVRMWSC